MPSSGDEIKREELYLKFYDEIQKQYDSERPVDCVVIVASRQQKDYAENIGRQARDMGLTVDLIMLSSQNLLGQALNDVRNGGSAFAIAVMPPHVTHNCCSVHVLQGNKQQHHDTPLPMAMELVGREFETYMGNLRERRRSEIARQAAERADSVLRRQQRPNRFSEVPEFRTSFSTQAPARAPPALDTLAPPLHARASPADSPYRSGPARGNTSGYPSEQAAAPAAYAQHANSLSSLRSALSEGKDMSLEELDRISEQVRFLREKALSERGMRNQPAAPPRLAEGGIGMHHLQQNTPQAHQRLDQQLPNMASKAVGAYGNRAAADAPGAAFNSGNNNNGGGGGAMAAGMGRQGSLPPSGHMAGRQQANNMGQVAASRPVSPPRRNSRWLPGTPSVGAQSELSHAPMEDALQPRATTSAQGGQGQVGGYGNYGSMGRDFSDQGVRMPSQQQQQLVPPHQQQQERVTSGGATSTTVGPTTVNPSSIDLDNPNVRKALDMLMQSGPAISQLVKQASAAVSQKGQSAALVEPQAPMFRSPPQQQQQQQRPLMQQQQMPSQPTHGMGSQGYGEEKGWARQQQPAFRQQHPQFQQQARWDEQYQQRY
nr:nuclear receptor coactivator 5-like isoform X2 [Petromyzon marinus]